MEFNGGLGFERSYYLASANGFTAAPMLEGDIEADLCVIGGGCTGLSAALHAAEAGYSVILLEGGRIGWGASGRNGGQIIPGLRKGAVELVDRYGAEDARRLFELGVEARYVLVDLIERHGIDCDLKSTGHLVAAVKPADLEDIAKEVECLARVMDYPHAVPVDRFEIAAEIGTDGYCGGLLDRLGGHYHPLNFTLGLAEAARKAGVRLFEQSPASSIENTASGVRVKTASASVNARFGVLAGDALLGQLEPGIARHIMPVGNYLVATEPLGDWATLLPNDRAVSDSRFVVNYYRLSADRRLIFGGGERYTPSPPADIAEFAGAHMRRVFPHLANRRIDYAWGGVVSVTRTRLPHFGRIGNFFFAHGYSGLGVALSSFAGQLIGEAMQGTAERFDLMARFAPRAFPGGRILSDPLYVMAMLWYAMRDRL